MKSRLLILSLIGVVALSCGKETTERGDEQAKQISFSPLLTRGSTINDPGGLATNGGFNVWAYRHADNKWASSSTKTPLLNAATVTGSVNGSVITWDYGTPVLWPFNEYVSFFAYGPADNATVNGSTTGGIPIIDFTVETAVKNQTDLLIASPIYDQLGVSYSLSKPVNLLFNHALSRVVFSGLLLNTGDTREIKVKSIKLNGIYNSGSVAVSNPVSWTVSTTSTSDYTLNIAGGNLKDIAISNTAQDISTDDSQLFLIPQTIARALGEDPTMDVVLNIDGDDMTYSSLVFSPDKWLPGKSYNYQLIVDGNDLQLIMIDGDMTLVPWDVYIAIQPIPLSQTHSWDMARLESAIMSFATLSALEDIDPTMENCQYFAIYLKNDVNHDLTVDITPHSNSFAPGEELIFDGEKIIGAWKQKEDEVPSRGYKFEVIYDEDEWALRPARQKVEANAYSGETTLSPQPFLLDTGSIVLKRLPFDDLP